MFILSGINIGRFGTQVYEYSVRWDGKRGCLESKGLLLLLADAHAARGISARGVEVLNILFIGRSRIVFYNPDSFPHDIGVRTQKCAA